MSDTITSIPGYKVYQSDLPSFSEELREWISEELKRASVELSQVEMMIVFPVINLGSFSETDDGVTTAWMDMGSRESRQGLWYVVFKDPEGNERLAQFTVLSTLRLLDGLLDNISEDQLIGLADVMIAVEGFDGVQ